MESDPGKGITTSRSKPRLKRKSLSLEQTSARNEEVRHYCDTIKLLTISIIKKNTIIYLFIIVQSRIWGTDSNMSSLQSLESSDAEGRALSLQRDSSVDR